MSCVLQFLIALILLSVSEMVMGAEQLSPIPWELEPQSTLSQGMHHLIITGLACVPREQ